MAVMLSNSRASVVALVPTYETRINLAAASTATDIRSAARLW
jgi:hypothetical protein